MPPVAQPLRVLSVVGTRPNFMKMAPVATALVRRPDEFEHVLVHTGQHYDFEMSQAFVEELGLGEPDHFLDVGSGSHSQQTARVMERLEPVLLEAEPDLMIVPGDVNSTLAATLAGARLGIPVAHVEAGLRSFDRTMPEETNRLLTDQLAELLFIHSPEARDNLLREGRPETAIHFVGNTMIDSLVRMRDAIEAAGAPAAHGVASGEYLLVTLHRPALVDGPLLHDAVARLSEVAERLPVLFPAHPRTQAAIEAEGIPVGEGVRLLPPLGYVEFLSLVAGAGAVLTDSGGIQEETTVLGVPCLTLRDNTERPATVTHGTNRIVGSDPDVIRAEVQKILAGGEPQGRIPDLWDGQAARRIADVLEREVRR
jgi:UDP-N-acetylglucosamine 2-epimerase (non-hydrolysing)